MLNGVGADCALINSGSMRSDQIHKKGEFKMRDLKMVLPFLDESIVISLSGLFCHSHTYNDMNVKRI